MSARLKLNAFLGQNIYFCFGTIGLFIYKSIDMIKAKSISENKCRVIIGKGKNLKNKMMSRYYKCLSKTEKALN